jgi:hypothetical protein
MDRHLAKVNRRNQSLGELLGFYTNLLHLHWVIGII